MPPYLFTFLTFICILSYNLLATDVSVSPEISTNKDFQIVSAYDETNQALVVKFYLDESSTIGMELYKSDGAMLKIWQPQMAKEGQYISSLTLEEIPDGTYLLNVIINEDMYQQAVFKY